MSDRVHAADCVLHRTHAGPCSPQPRYDEGAPAGEPLKVLPPGELSNWWMGVSADDVRAMLPKLNEYGSTDLLMIGTSLCDIAGWDDATDTEKQAVGCYFYLLGKITRAMEALKAHRLPSDDTDHDLTVYSMMIRRIRQEGTLR